MTRFSYEDLELKSGMDNQIELNWFYQLVLQFFCFKYENHIESPLASNYLTSNPWNIIARIPEPET